MFVVGFEVGVGDAVVVGIEVGDNLKSGGFTISNDVAFKSMGVEEVLLEVIVNI